MSIALNPGTVNDPEYAAWLLHRARRILRDLYAEHCEVLTKQTESRLLGNIALLKLDQDHERDVLAHIAQAEARVRDLEGGIA